MYFRQNALTTALYAMLALVGATARAPMLDAGIHDWRKERNSAYRIEPGVVALMEENIVS